MRGARAAAVVTWVYAACYGIPAIPVSIFLVRNGRLPRLWGLFDMYGGPWSTRFQQRDLVLLLMAFLAITVVAAGASWLVWKGSRAGAVLCVVLLPAEAVFWYGFALPIPWLTGLARAVLIGMAWRSLGRSRHTP